MTKINVFGVSLTEVKKSTVFANKMLKCLERSDFCRNFAPSISERAGLRQKDNLVLIKLRKGNKNEKIVYGSCSHAEHDDDIR